MMPGSAAVAVWCDVGFEVKDEFDDWHAHEHMPERLSIPGCLRGSRWVSTDGRNAYFTLYEAKDLATITTGPYLERLNNPTPWSTKMMPHHRNMVRSLCRVQAGFGSCVAQFLLTLRLTPEPGAEEKLGNCLTAELLAKIPSRKGLVSAQLLQDAARPQGTLTTEQKIRGGDATADWIVLVNGYDAAAVDAVAADEVNAGALAAHGAAPGSIARVYRLAIVLTPGDLQGIA